MYYFVTYAVMDQQLANPFWHAFIIASKQSSDDSKVEVDKAWGYYPAPMAPSDSLIKKLHKLLGFNFDLSGNHGVWKVEEMRYLDLGYGLKGVTFEVTKDQYTQLHANFKTKLNSQDETIRQLKESLSEELDDPSAVELYQKELELAAQENRSPKLDRFDFLVSWTDDGFTLNQSNTCKTMAIKSFKEIDVDEWLLEGITQSNTSLALPRWSGELEPIYLHSEGPSRKHESQRTKKITFFRTWDDGGVKLYWSMPPHDVLTVDGKRPLIPDHISEGLLGKIGSCIGQLQRIEKVVINADVSRPDEAYKKRLADFIHEMYGAFSVIPQDVDKQALKEKVNECKLFLNSLYFAINDDWDDDEEVEAVASRFDIESQKKICSIMGRAYAKGDLTCTIV